MQLAIFPFSINILPDGVLPLRIFEQRYIRMIAESQKRGMGLCCWVSQLMADFHRY